MARRKRPKPETPAQRLADDSWRMRHSLWMLWGILSLGLLTTVGYAYIGRRAGRRAWLIAAAVWAGYAVVVVTVFAIGGAQVGWDPTAGFTTTMGTVTVAAWVTAIVLQVGANREWLAWRTEHPR